MKSICLFLMALFVPILGQSATHTYVDLGLPSGTMWATCNVGATTPEGYGSFFAWGETATKKTYSWTNYQLSSKGTAASVTSLSNFVEDYGFSGNVSYDAAQKAWGDSWRTPTVYQMDELRYYCTADIIVQNGVKGYKYTGPNGNSIFMPLSGYKYDSKYLGKGSETYYWTSNRDNENKAKARAVHLTDKKQTTSDRCWRRTGLPIRPVINSGLVFVDLGLSKNWASCNIGATSPEQRGRLYAWGEIFPKKTYTWKNYKHAQGSATTVESMYDISGYSEYDPSAVVGKLFNPSFEDNIDENEPLMVGEIPDPDLYYYPDDAGIATPYFENAPGSGYTAVEMPSKDDFEELIYKCQWKIVTQNNVKCYKVTGPSGSSIYLPLAGCSYDGKTVGNNTNAYYWSGTISDNMQKANALYLENGKKEVRLAQRRTGVMIRPVSYFTNPSIPPEPELILGNFVDLGLSVLWADTPLWEGYLAWGETQAKNSYTWSNYEHAKGTSASCVFLNPHISGYYSWDASLSQDMFDEEREDFIYGRMPYEDEFNELLEKCTFTVETENIEGEWFKGYRVTGPNGNSIFMPFTGCSYDGKDRGMDSYAYFWTGDYDPKVRYKARAAYLSDSERKVTSAQRRTGMMVWPVARKLQAIDLGLPSGNRWAKCNLDAVNPQEFGTYYAWGEEYGKNDYTWRNYKWANGTASSVFHIGDEISGVWEYFYDEDCEDDTPGSCWSVVYYDPCMNANDQYVEEDSKQYMMLLPTKKDYQELINYCTTKEGTISGIKGVYFTGPNGNSIFMPYAGSCYDGKNASDGTLSYYWTGELSSTPSKAHSVSLAKGKANFTTCQRRTGLPIRGVYIYNEGEYSNKGSFATDGVKEPDASLTVDDNSTYTLQGVKVEGNLQPGIYIRNGKKFIVK